MAVEIRLQSFTKRIGAATIVDGIDLTVPTGRMLFVLGPSGCGKTTLLRMVAGLTELSAGKLFFGDVDVTDLPTRKRNIGMVFQNYALWPHMTVLDNVAFGLRMRKVSKAERTQRARSVLENVGLSAMADRKPGQLSGGQQQRVALARALVVEPDLLLLDEPLSNLDANLRVQLRELIRTLCKQTGVTTLYVTHDQEEAMALADEVVVMRDGRIEQQGAPAHIYAHPISVEVASFLGEVNLLDGEVASIVGGEVAIRTKAGEILARMPSTPLREQQHVVCAFRPQSLTLSTKSAGLEAATLFQGTLHESTRRGLWSRHVVRVGDTVDLIVHEPGTAARAAGTLCALGLDAADVVILPPPDRPTELKKRLVAAAAHT